MIAHSFDLEDGYCHIHREFCSMAADAPEGDEVSA